MRERPCADWRWSYCGASFFSSLSKFHTTASAVNSEPSWNFTPSRILNIQRFLLASAGSTP